MPDTFDVILPDGTPLRGVPVGTTKEQIEAKAKANGYNFDTPKSQPPGIMDEAKSGLARIGSMWPESVTPTDIALIPAAIGGEGLALKGAQAVGNMATRAAPRLAEFMATTPEARGASRLAGFAGAGAAGWGTAGAASGAVNAEPDKRIEGAIQGGKSGAEMGAEFGAGGAVASKVIPPVARAIFHPIESTQKVMKAAAKPVVRAALNSDNPLIGGGLKKDLAAPDAQKARELGKRLGVNFSAAEQTGNTAARGVEDTLANSPKYSSKFAEANEQKTTAVVDKFKQTLGGISPEETNVAGLGDRLTKAYKGSIDSLVNTRSAQGKVDFEAARQATGGAPVIVPENVIEVYKKFIEEGASPTATKEQAATAAQAKEALAKLTEKPAPASKILDAGGKLIERPAPAQYKKITVNDLQNGLQGSGEAAKSPGTITGGLKTASDRRFDKALKDAYESDLDAAADSGTGEGAAQLKVARDNWRATSAKIGDIQQTALGKIVGGAQRDSQGNLVLFPEKLADRFMSMDTTEIKTTLKFLDQEHPDVAKMARRFTLEAAYKKAAEGVGQSAAGGIKEFDMAGFVKGLPSDDKLVAILGDKKAVGEVHDVAEALNRLRWYGGRKSGSQTFGRTEILNGFKGWGAKKLYQSALDDTLAEDMLNPQKRAGLTAEANKINGRLNADQAIGAVTDPLAKAAVNPEARMAELERAYDSGKLSPEQRAATLKEMDALADQAIKEKGL